MCRSDNVDPTSRFSFRIIIRAINDTRVMIIANVEHVDIFVRNDSVEMSEIIQCPLLSRFFQLKTIITESVSTLNF